MVDGNIESKFHLTYDFQEKGNRSTRTVASPACFRYCIS
uniref:Uncharacterized protein n=1 Tax=Anguilla anguilla TaxID=7936 RepID=A0A0E9W5A0_ANGAN